MFFHEVVLEIQSAHKILASPLNTHMVSHNSALCSMLQVKGSKVLLLLVRELLELGMLGVAHKVSFCTVHLLQSISPFPMGK